MNKNELQYSQFMSNWSCPLYFIIEIIRIISWSEYWPSSHRLSLWFYRLWCILFRCLSSKYTIFWFFKGLEWRVCWDLGAWKEGWRLWFDPHRNLHILYLLLFLLFLRNRNEITLLTMKRSFQKRSLYFPTHSESKVRLLSLSFASNLTILFHIIWLWSFRSFIYDWI